MNTEEQLHKIRHTLAHLLASSVLELFPGSENAIGPAIENGFYQDFEIKGEISDKDLPRIEKKMREKIKEWDRFEARETSLEEVNKIFTEIQDNKYKRVLAEEFIGEGKTITLQNSQNKNGKIVFWDLCKGGHVESPVKEIKPDAFKLDRLAGAYWRGDEKNKMLTRIYGLAFETKEELEAYEKMREEALKRDHRKLGKELDLFTFSEYVGSGLPLYTPKGALIRKLLNEYVEELQSEAGYMQVWTPQIAKASLFKTSGHYDKYKEDMFRVVSNYSEEEFYLKPMNCPQQTQIYASQKRS